MPRHTLRALLVGALTLLTALTAATVTPASAANWTFVWMQSTTSEVCAAAMAPANGTPMTQESCVEDLRQLWTFESVNSTQYRVRNNGTGKCLSTINGTTVGTVLIQDICSTSFAQRWTLVGTGNTFRITAVAGGNCIQRPGELAGSTLVQGTCTLERTRWRLLY
jgi:hypothetical protein